MKFWAGLFAVLLCASTSYAQGPTSVDGVNLQDAPPLAAPFAVARLASPNNPWLGEMAQIEVKLYRDNRRENGAPFFGETHVAGGMAQLSKWSPIAEVEKRDGVEYLVQTRMFQVFPQYGEAITFPAIEVSWFEDDTKHSTLTEPIEFPVRQQELPSGPWMASTKVTVTQEVKGDLDGFRVGDAVTRVITIEADGTDAVMIPVPTVAQVDDLTAYPSEPQLISKSTRGEFTATREDRVTYVAQSWGFYELPAVQVHWFDTSTGTWAVAMADPIRFRARVNPDVLLRDSVSGESLPFATLILVLLTLAGGVFLRLRRTKTPKSAPHRLPDASKRLTDVILHAKAGDAVKTMNALFLWFGALNPSPVTITDLAKHDEEFLANVEQLNRDVALRASDWNGAEFEQKLRPSKTTKYEATLGPMNP